MRLSRESEYGVEGMRVLAARPAGTVMRLEEIAEAGELPVHFLAKIFQKLGRHRLVRSHRGAVRGYSLGRAPGAITMREIVEAIEGPALRDILGDITLAQVAAVASRPAPRAKRGSEPAHHRPVEVRRHP